MDRRTFLRRGAAALGGLVTIPYLDGKTIAIARPITSNRLSDYARGNDTNEHDAILAWWTSGHDYLIVDAPDGPRKYGFDPGRPFRMRSNLMVENVAGENAKFVRAEFEPRPVFIKARPRREEEGVETVNYFMLKKKHRPSGLALMRLGLDSLPPPYSPMVR